MINKTQTVNFTAKLSVLYKGTFCWEDYFYTRTGDEGDFQRNFTRARKKPPRSWSSGSWLWGGQCAADLETRDRRKPVGLRKESCPLGEGAVQEEGGGWSEGHFVAQRRASFFTDVLRRLERMPLTETRKCCWTWFGDLWPWEHCIYRSLLMGLQGTATGIWWNEQ